MNEIHITFAADRMLGSLCKWLRILGFDCSFVSIESSEQIKRLQQEGRRILTRNTRWRHEEGILWIEENDSALQLKTLVRMLGLSGESLQLLQRCLRCNQLLRKIPKQEVLGRIPEFVYNSQDCYHSCPVCGKLYWSGSHPEKMMRRLHELFGNSSFSVHLEEDQR